MATMMVVRMDVADDGWMKPYFEVVPDLLAEYGARSLAGGRDIVRIEGDGEVPERIAILEFPTRAAVIGFMDDPRYLPFRNARRAGSRSEIWIFDNQVRNGELL